MSNKILTVKPAPVEVIPSDAQVASALETYLNAHPEAMLKDGSVSISKLDSELQGIAVLAPEIVQTKVEKFENVTNLFTEHTGGYFYSSQGWKESVNGKAFIISKEDLATHGLMVYNSGGNGHFINAAEPSMVTTATPFLASSVVTADRLADGQYLCYSGDNANIVVYNIQFAVPERRVAVDYGVPGFSEVYTTDYVGQTAYNYGFKTNLPSGLYAIARKSVANKLNIYWQDGSGYFIINSGLPMVASKTGYEYTIFYLVKDATVYMGFNNTNELKNDSYMDEYFAILKPDSNLPEIIKPLQPKFKRFIVHRSNFKHQYIRDLAYGVSGIEIDVRMTKDGVMVLAHDDTIDGVSVSGSTYAELATALPYISTVEECMKACSKYQCYVYIHGAVADNFTALKRLMNQYNLADKAVYCALTCADHDETSVFVNYNDASENTISTWSESKKERCIVFWNNTNFSGVADGLRCESWLTDGCEEVLANDRISGICTDAYHKVYLYRDAENRAW